MDKREFFEFLRDEIIEAMPELENAQFFTREVKKDNNRVYNALNIKRPELSISPSYNFDSLYNEYERTGGHVHNHKLNKIRIWTNAKP